MQSKIAFARRHAPVLGIFLALTFGACSATNNGVPDTSGPSDAHGDGSQNHGDGTSRIDGSNGDDGGVIDDTAGSDDVAMDIQSIYDTGGTATDGCMMGSCSPHPDGCSGTENCGGSGGGNGLDDNCNGVVDENCPCIPGTVQDCFLGPPGSRGIGACHDGTQRCEGSGEFGTWSACTGGISPGGETCDNLDNNCNGCADEGLCCGGTLDCPGPGDPRVPDGTPFSDYALRGEVFFPGMASGWNWTVVGGPCDTTLPHPTYTLTGATSRDATFHPTLSGDYTVTLTVTLSDGTTVSCTFIVHIAGPGLRVELCWDTSTTVDLDLYLHDPRSTTAWFSSSASPLSSVTNASCNWSNCEAVLRGSTGRENWGYSNSPLSECQNGPHGADWLSLGYCGNPRLDIDNNLSKASGSPENINVDTPRDRERFRVMVENFTGTAAHPIVNVYCGGHLRGTIGAAPDRLPDFTGTNGGITVGAMWRAADVVVHVDGTGATTDCDVTPLHPAGATTGFFVTRDDPSY